ncbi:MAG: 50S ribosomal protein L29 [Deltaproteobacteria bacterium]|nr:50S ribosomal protein L29 [Deltaproteobacteria bacterium]
MKVSEIRELSLEELSKKEEELGKELFNLKYQHHTAQLENTARMRQVRRDIARLKTIAAEKQQ